MLILGIETSGPRVSCAIGDGRVVRASWGAARGPRHAEVLTPAVAAVLDAAGIRVADLDLVAVSQGPGLFTGLRVGIATAQAIAFGCGIPLVGVPTLDVVAQAGRASGRTIVAVTDARRGELFHAPFAAAAGLRPGPATRLGEDRVSPPDALLDELAALEGPLLIVGDGVDRYPEVFDRLASEGRAAAQLLGGPAALPAAAVVVELAAARTEGEVPAQPVGAPPLAALRPIYVRAPDAEAHWEQRAAVLTGDAA